jgi:hypothetical protein
MYHIWEKCDDGSFNLLWQGLVETKDQQKKMNEVWCKALLQGKNIKSAWL